MRKRQKLELGKCFGCNGTGKVLKMPEQEKKVCRLCGGFGFDN